jgi:hypothetical protein
MIQFAVPVVYSILPDRNCIEACLADNLTVPNLTLHLPRLDRERTALDLDRMYTLCRLRTLPPEHYHGDARTRTRNVQKGTSHAA